MSGAASLQVAPLEGAPLWRRDPYRVFFPLAVLLGAVGVGQWLLYVAQVTHYRAIFHATVQVQAFLACFIVGFLFTFIPRRTFGAPPAAWQMVVGLVAPVGLTVAGWWSAWTVAQGFWLALMAMMVQFVATRMVASRNQRPSPSSLLWVPLSLLVGVVASLGATLSAQSGAMRLHDAFSSLLLQGVVGGLIMGVGAMLVPVVTRAEPPREVPSMLSRVTQLAWATAFIASFFIELSAPRVGFALRAGIALVVLGVGAQLWRIPTMPGLHRWLVWVGAWCLPLGYAAAAASPQTRQLGLHVVFIGSFGSLVLGIGAHVMLSHANRPDALTRPSWLLRACVALLLASGLFRSLLAIDPGRTFVWMALGSASFLGCLGAWAAWTFPFVRRTP